VVHKGFTEGSQLVSGADYGIWDYSQNQAVEVNSTNFKDPQ